MFIASLIGIAIFIAYIIVSVAKFGVPPSLSDTYYLYGGKPKGYIFTAVLWITVFCLIPQWISITPESLVFLVFLACAGLLLVGAAPIFKSRDDKWHQAFAIICAIAAIAWEIVMKQYIILGSSVIAILLIALLTKTLKKGKTFYLEMMAFLSAFSSIIYLSI